MSTSVPAAPSAATAVPSSSAPPVIVNIDIVNDEVRLIGNSTSHVHRHFRFLATASTHVFETPPTSALDSEAFDTGDVFVHHTQGGPGASTARIWQFKEGGWVNVTHGYHEGKIHHPSIPGYVLVPSTRDVTPTYILLKSFMNRKRP